MKSEVQLLSELTKYTQDMASVGNIKDYIQVNRQDCVHKLAKVIQYRDYIANHCGAFTKASARKIMQEMIAQNPSLDKVFNQKSKTQEKQTFDTRGISSRIEQIRDRISSMRGIDTEELESCKSDLLSCNEELKRYRSSMKNGDFIRLHNDVCVILHRINSIALDLEDVDRINRGM